MKRRKYSYQQSGAAIQNLLLAITNYDLLVVGWDISMTTRLRD